jgi:DNA polymerase-3 subunit alpha
VDKIAKMIPAIPGKPVTINDVLTEGHEFYNPELVQLYESSDWVRELVDTSMQLEGVARHAGIHAAAVIVADRELEHYTPLMRGTKSTVTETIAQYEFPILESIGLLKVDFLGLSTLSVVREAGRLVKERHGIDYNLSNIPFEGEEAAEAFKLLSSGEVSGVFQVESQGMRRVLTEMKPSAFEHIIATISLYRPGPLEYIPQFIRRMHGEEEVDFKHEALASILTETYGIIVYQEQIIQILSQLAGYTPGDADLVRRAIGKKKASEIERHKQIFIEGCEGNGIPKATATAIYEDIEFFARYGFNKCLPGDVEVVDAATGRLIRIEDLYDETHALDTTVTCDTGSLALGHGRVRVVMDNGVKPVYRLTTGLGRTIEATNNHPFYTFDGWRQLGELSTGDMIAVPRTLPVEGTCEWPEHEVIALGHLLAEGNLCHPHSVYYYSQDPEQVEDYVRAAERFANVTCSIGLHRGTYSVYAKRVERTKPPGIVSWCKSLDMWGKNARKKEIPAAAFELTNAQLALLVARMWEGDGHINVRGRSLFYATASERLARQLQHIFLRFGIISKLRTVEFPYKDGRIGYQLFITGNENLGKFRDAFGLHFLSETRRTQLDSLVLETVGSWSTKDVVPLGVKEAVRSAKAEAGVTWQQLNDACGVAQREFYPTGAGGKNGFARQTIGRLADYFDSPDLRRHAENDIYWDKVVSVEYVGEKQTYDLEVPGTHNFVANDILVHNSHAADYAVICVQTAYLKARFPVEYMAALLLIERDKTEKVTNFINECRRMGIDVLPPDINYSGLDFEIQELPEETESQAHRDPYIGYAFPVPEGSAIRFGMAAIKNVGEGPVKVIIDARNEGGPFVSLDDFCDRVDLRQVSKRALEFLIKAGALDRFGKRSQLLAVLDQMVAHSAGIHAARESGQLSMFDLMETPTQTAASAIRLPDIEEAKGRERLQWEKELLGVYTMSHPLQHLSIDIGKVVTCASNELDERYDGKNVTMAGMIADVRVINTKKGDQMAFVQLEDLQGQCEVVVFPRTYAEYKEKLVPDTIVLVKGKAQTREGSTSVLADSLQNYVDQAKAIGSEDDNKYQSPLLDVAPTINGVAFANGDDSNSEIMDEESEPDMENGDKAKPAGKQAARSENGDLNRALAEDEVMPTGEANPFRNEAPAWARGETEMKAKKEEAHQEHGDAGRSEESKRPGSAAQQASSDTEVVGPDAAKSELTDQDGTGKPAAKPMPEPRNEPETESHQNGDERGANGHARPGNGGRRLTITFRRSGDIDRDMYRLKEIYERVRDPRGHDHFVIRLDSRGRTVTLAFPDDPCSVSDRLTNELTKHFRVEVRVEA